MQRKIAAVDLGSLVAQTVFKNGELDLDLLLKLPKEIISIDCCIDLMHQNKCTEEQFLDFGLKLPDWKDSILFFKYLQEKENILKLLKSCYKKIKEINSHSYSPIIPYNEIFSNVESVAFERLKHNGVLQTDKDYMDVFDYFGSKIGSEILTKINDRKNLTLLMLSADRGDFDYEFDILIAFVKQLKILDGGSWEIIPVYEKFFVSMYGSTYDGTFGGLNMDLEQAKLLLSVVKEEYTDQFFLKRFCSDCLQFNHKHWSGHPEFEI